MFLIHHGVTDWHRDGKLLGRRDVPMNADGRAQAERIAGWLADMSIAEVISSPLQRALQTAELVGKRFDIELARDPRLTDVHLGQWEGKPAAEALASEAYQELLANPLSAAAPGGESFHEVKTRAAAAIEQALEDNPAGAGIAVITHARVIRVLLAHYMGAPPATVHRLRVHPGTVSVLGFSHESHRPRILAVNWAGGLGELLALPEQPL